MVVEKSGDAGVDSGPAAVPDEVDDLKTAAEGGIFQ
jgi:hypothetical protein